MGDAFVGMMHQTGKLAYLSGASFCIITGYLSELHDTCWKSSTMVDLVIRSKVWLDLVISTSNLLVFVIIPLFNNWPVFHTLVGSSVHRKHWSCA